MAGVASVSASPLLNVNGIEVIYNHVILVLKGVSLSVPQGGIVALPRVTSSTRASGSRRSRPTTWSSAAWSR